MNSELEILKGIHPGFVLERKIREKGLKKGKLAIDCREYPQTLTAITKGKRDMNTALSLKLEKALELEEGYFMILQVYYDIHKQKRSPSQKHKKPPHLHKVLFWDTDFDSIDWERQYRSIINRVMERGSEKDKSEMIKFYGAEKVKEIMNELSASQTSKQ